MKLTRIFPPLLAAALALALSACGAAETKPALPEPAALMEEIEQSVSLPELAAMDADYLRQNTGIAPEDYESMAYRVPAGATAPDELVIVRAADAAAAAAIAEKLEAHLAYREESARVYLTEYLPILREGVVRRDGLTVSLLVSERVAGILEVYDRYQ